MTAPKVDESTDVVVVVPPADPVPAPQYVTSGELDARLQEMETRLGQSIEAAVSAGFAAQVAADEAAIEAAAAASTAEVAVEVALDAADAVEEATADAGAGEEEQDGPRAPQPRVEPAGGGSGEAPEKPKRSYGAKSIYG